METQTNEHEPWEQMEGEPKKAYACFLLYRDLGPSRSLDKAQNSYRQGKAPDSTEKHHVSGSWKAWSSKYRWPDRAYAWDIAHLSRAGSDVVVAWVKSLAGLSQCALEAVESGKHKPRNLKQLLEVIDVLGRFVTPETVEAARQFAGGDFGHTPNEHEPNTV